MHNHYIFHLVKGCGVLVIFLFPMGGSEAIGKVISALVISKQCSKQQNLSFLFLIVISFILMAGILIFSLL